MQIFLFAIGILLFAGLVIVHEFGHYWVAKRNGVGADEFGIGLPPRAFGRMHKSGLLLSVNWLPLGGFVKLRGESDSDKRKGSFGAASLSAKSKIILAGVTANLLVGLLLLTFLAVAGMPKLITKESVGQDQFTVASDTKIARQDLIAGYIQQGSPADKIGLSSRDFITKVKYGNDVRVVNSTEQLHNATHDFAGKTVLLSYKHGGQEITKQVTLLSAAVVTASQKTDDPKGNLGVSPTELQIRRSTWSAPIVALGFTKQLMVLTFQGLGHAIGGLGSIIAGGVTGNHEARENGQTQATAQVGGPVAIGAILWGSGTLGIYFVLMIIAVISLTLALMNILPIPALDGGRLVMILTSRLVLKRPLQKSTEEKIVGTSMAVLLALFVLITIVDVKRFL